MLTRLLLVVAALAPLASASALPVEEHFSYGRELQSTGSPSAPPAAATNSSIGSCFTPYVYNLIMNTVSMRDSYAADARRVAENNTNIDNGRLTIETGNRVTTIIVLFVFLGISLVLMIMGEHLAKFVVISVTGLAAFMCTLYLFQWAFPSSVVPMEGFNKCVTPFILTCLCTLIAIILVVVMSKRAVWLSFFILGAAGGAFGMFMLRLFILAGNPGLAQSTAFNFYWLALGVVALIAGIVAVKMKKSVMVVVTCLIGGYGFAVAVCGLIPVFNGPYLANYVFFIIFGFTVLIAAFHQIKILPSWCPAKQERDLNFVGELVGR